MILEKKNVVIFGLGKSGLAAFRLCLSKKANISIISSGLPSEWKDYSKVKGHAKLLSQEDFDSRSAMEVADYVILSPGISLEHELIKNIKAEVFSEVELASRFIDFGNKKVIALTGTNGKTTTVHMLEEAIRLQEEDIFLGGNVGIPFCDYLNNKESAKYIVLELSSFQLETLKTLKIDSGAILNIAPNHGERYSSIKGYALAKAEIVKLLRKKENFFVDQSTIDNGIVGQLITDKGLSKYNLDSFDLPGGHNLINLSFVDKLLNSIGDFKKGIQLMIDSFKGVEHRLEKVESKDSFSVFNDAKSTNWLATESAVKSLLIYKKDIVLICGGKLRGENDYPSEEQVVFFKDKVKSIYLIGESGEILVDFFTSKKIKCELNKKLDLTLEKIRKNKETGIVLFSPAFPSFDQFSNYIDRGNSFKNLLS